jgi:hypothetical protein
MVRQVLLEGGPRHGEHIDVEDGRQLITLDWEEESLESTWPFLDDEVSERGIRSVYVSVRGIASYRRVAADRFEFCATPTSIGDSERIVKGE